MRCQREGSCGLSFPSRAQREPGQRQKVWGAEYSHGTRSRGFPPVLPQGDALGETGLNALGRPYQGGVKVSKTQSSKLVNPHAHVLWRDTRRTGIEEGVPQIAQEPRSRSLVNNSCPKIFSPRVPKDTRNCGRLCPPFTREDSFGYR